MHSGPGRLAREWFTAIGLLRELRACAMTVVPGKPGTAAVDEVANPASVSDGLLVRGLLVGVCGTDHEIAEGAYGEPPSGHAKLILGHEGLGEVLEAPGGSGFQPGDLVVGIVQRPDPVPCPACAAGDWDMCALTSIILTGAAGEIVFNAERL